MQKIDYGNIGAIWGSVLSEDGDYLAVTSGSPDLSLSFFYKTALKWRKELHGIARQVAMSGERVFTGVYSKQGAGSVFMFHIDGKLLWSKKVTKRVVSVAVGEEFAVMGDSESTIYLFDGDGMEIARSQVRQWKEPVFVHMMRDMVVVVLRGGDVFLLNSNLEVLRKFSTGMVTGCSAISDARIYLGDYSSPLVRCYDLHGTPLWESTGYHAHPSSISAQNERIVMGNERGELIVADAGGNLLFKKLMNHPITTTSLSKEYIAIGCNDFYVYLLDHEGKIVWEYRLGTGELKRVDTRIRRLEKYQDVIPALKKKVKVIRSQYRMGNYNVAMDFLTEAEEIFVRYRDDIQRMESAEAVSKLVVLLQEAEKDGLAPKILEEYSRVLQSLRSGMEKGEYVAVKENAEATMRMIKKEMFRAKRRNAKRTIEEIERKIAALNEDIERLDLGDDEIVNRGKEALLNRLRGVKAEYELHSYCAVMREGKELMNEINELRERIRTRNLMVWHTYLLERISWLGEILSTQKEMDMLTILEEAIEKGDEVSAVKLIHEIQDLLEEKEGAYLQRESKRQIRELTAHLRESISDSMAWAHLNAARELYSAGLYLEALREAEEGYHQLQKNRNRYEE